ncbi:hypothetical protein ACEPAH_2304 [Sanghuangporus vaninii]
MKKKRSERVEKTKVQGSVKRSRDRSTGSAIAGASGFSSCPGQYGRRSKGRTLSRRWRGYVSSGTKNNKDKVPVGGAGSSGKLEAQKYDDEVFWDGELCQIANRLVDQDKHTRLTFWLSEIIGPRSEITLAILSS